MQPIWQLIISTIGVDSIFFKSQMIRINAFDTEVEEILPHPPME